MSRQARRQARREAKAEKKAEKREYKLAKQAQRQATRLGKVETRQASKTDRTQIRQDSKTDRKISQNEADMVAYEHGLQPINRTAGIISASGEAASGLADLAMSLSGAGMFGKDIAALNTGFGKNREISFDDDGDIREMSDRVSPWSAFGGNPNAPQSPIIWVVIIGVVAILFMNNNNKRR
jgi:hypothetical protein